MKETNNHINKKQLGQYFTPKIVAEFMLSLANIDSQSRILEPSCGQGVFLDVLAAAGYSNISAYEIDDSLRAKHSNIIYDSFVSANIQEKFDLVIGNPPYIRWKNLEDSLKSELLNNPLWNKYFNSLCDYLYIFILKSIELLNENGQLIFICPEYWMNTTHSETLRNYMVQNGYFEEIYHFNETPIFDKVTVSTVIFKYIKSTKLKKDKIKVAKYHSNKKITKSILNNLKNKIDADDIEFLEVPQFELNQRWLLQNKSVQDRLKLIEIACNSEQDNFLFNSADNNNYYTIGDICEIGNGLVSGLDKAFQLNGHKLNDEEFQATINVVKAKDLAPFFTYDITKYIFIKDGLSESQFQNAYPNFYNHFQQYKVNLEKRYQYNRKINYWEWVFLRNFKLFDSNERRIFVPCKERISNKDYFRFALVDGNIFPTQDVTAIFKKKETKESIEYILAYLNNEIIFEWLKNYGIVKGNIVEFSEKPISSIPFRKINWDDEMEVNLHNIITDLTTLYLSDKNPDTLNKINFHINQLLNIKEC